MEIRAFLERIRYDSSVAANPETLQRLHRAHMLAVPFENLDIVPLGRPIQLSEQALWDKIVVRRRGGFCYELNGLFAWLLRQIGFDVTYLNARVFNREGRLGIDFDHLALLVRVPGESASGMARRRHEAAWLPRWPHASGMARRRHEAAWLADVGFGDSFTEPLSFEERGEQAQGLRAYKLEEMHEGCTVWQRNYAGAWERQYFFDLQPRSFPSEYEAACLYHQTSPGSSFTRGSIVSLATPDGRVSLEAGRLILTKDGRREERPVASEEYDNILRERFGLSL
jgi:N-hydroxyarylamine O-acetyltransferase